MKWLRQHDWKVLLTFFIGFAGILAFYNHLAALVACVLALVVYLFRNPLRRLISQRKGGIKHKTHRFRGQERHECPYCSYDTYDLAKFEKHVCSHRKGKA